MFGFSPDYNYGYSQGQADLRYWMNREIAGLNQSIAEWQDYARRMEEEQDATHTRLEHALGELTVSKAHAIAISDDLALAKLEMERLAKLVQILREDILRLNEQHKNRNRKMAGILTEHHKRSEAMSGALAALEVERQVLRAHVNNLIDAIVELDPTDERPGFVWLEIDRDVEHAIATLASGTGTASD